MKVTTGIALSTLYFYTIQLWSFIEHLELTTKKAIAWVVKSKVRLLDPTY